jgi:hypothetical protein
MQHAHQRLTFDSNAGPDRYVVAEQYYRFLTNFFVGILIAKKCFPTPTIGRGKAVGKKSVLKRVENLTNILVEKMTF